MKGATMSFKAQTTPTYSKYVKSAFAVALVLLLMWQPAVASLFTVGPDYKAPTNASPDQYKAEQLGSWKEGRPLDNVPKGVWWEVFGDPDLNELERQAANGNQNLRAAVARVSQARSTARVARGDLLPSLN